MDRLDHLTTDTERRIKIIEYVLERQMTNQRTTKAIVIRYMKSIKKSSRETTLNLINDLIEEGKLNKEEISSQFHLLTINKNWDMFKMHEELLRSQIEKALEPFPNILESKEIIIKGKPTSKGAASTGYTIKFKHKRRSKTDKEDEKNG